jgi:hypothetical protein
MLSPANLAEGEELETNILQVAQSKSSHYRELLRASWWPVASFGDASCTSRKKLSEFAEMRAVLR